MILNQANLRTLQTGFNASFRAGLNGADTFYRKVSMTTTSQTAEEEYGWLGQFPRVREWIGDRVIQNLSLSGFKIKNRDFESTLAVPRNSIADDKVGIYGPMFQEMGLETAETPDKLIAELIFAGFTTTCYDGQYFFDVDHPVINELGVEVSVSNFTAGSGVSIGPAWFLIDNTRAIAPFIYQEREKYRFQALDKDDDPNVFFKNEYIYGVHGRSNAGYGLWQLAHASTQPLNAANYAAARTAMSTRRGDNGRRLGIKPALLLVPSELESAGRKILNNNVGANGESNEWQGTAELVVTPWLSA